MLIILLGTLLVLLAILSIVIARRPATFSYGRSRLIAAPPERIYPLVEDFRAWTRWSPWENLDPASVRTYGATTAGVGATYHWKGNAKVGEGRMEIRAVQPPTGLEIAITFIRPFAASNRVDVTFIPGPTGTTVTWTMSGQNGFMAKAMGLVIDCERMVCTPFEQGLAQLAALSESTPS